MPTKVFTTIIEDCPFGKGVKIDSTACRNCPEYYRTGTGTFFWCRHPEPEKVPEPKKRGRPPKKTTSVPKTTIRKKRGRSPKKGGF